jgi:hypothetical protein
MQQFSSYRLRVVFSSLVLNRYSVRVALFIHPSGPLSGSLNFYLNGVVVGQSVLTLVLRLFASAELQLYRTSLPPPDHLENHLI